MVLVSHRREVHLHEDPQDGGDDGGDVLRAVLRLPRTPRRGRHRGRCARPSAEAGIVGSRRVGQARGDVWQQPHAGSATCDDLLGAEVWARYLKFAAVRNPYAIVLSSFFWKNARSYPDGEAAFERARRDFSGFVRGRPLARAPLGQRRSRSSRIDGEMQMDMLVRQERLADDIQAPSATGSGCPWNPELARPHQEDRRRAARPIRSQDFYTQETAAIVRREFDWVFSRLDYGLPQ